MSLSLRGDALADSSHAAMLENSAERPGKASDNNTFSELLTKIDSELCHIKLEASPLGALFGALKTKIIGEILPAIANIKHQAGPNASPKPPSYADIIRAGPLRSLPPLAKPIPPRELREIHIRRGEAPEDEATAGIEDIVKDLNHKLCELKAGQILGARRLQSGDLVLMADSADTKKRAEACKEDWIGLIGRKAELRGKRFPVYVHSVRVDTFDNSKQAEGIKKIYDQNPALRTKVQILRFHWRKRTRTQKKSWSSLLLDLDKAKGANTLIEEGLVLDNELKDVELFDPACLVSRCFNCQEYGHNAKFCRRPQRCGFCAAPGHGQEACPFKDQPAKQRCVNCQLGHYSGSSSCVRHAREITRVQRAREIRPRYFTVPDESIPPPVSRFFTTTPTIHKRQSAVTSPRKAGPTTGERPAGNKEWEVPSRKQRGRPPKSTLPSSSLGSITDFLNPHTASNMRAISPLPLATREDLETAPGTHFQVPPSPSSATALVLASSQDSMQLTDINGFDLDAPDSQINKWN
jgi:hypothetical protein